MDSVLWQTRKGNTKMRELRTPALNGSPGVSPRFPEIQNHPQTQWLKTRTIIFVHHAVGQTFRQLGRYNLSLLPVWSSPVTRVARGPPLPPLWAGPGRRVCNPLSKAHRLHRRLRAGGAADTRALEAWARLTSHPTVTTCRSSEHHWAGPAPGRGGRLPVRRTAPGPGDRRGLPPWAVSHGVTWKRKPPPLPNRWIRPFVSSRSCSA